MQVGPPAIAGVPIWEYSDDHRHDVDAQLRCCALVEELYFSEPLGRRTAPAPVYFLRAAILIRKEKNYSSELAICERWQALVNDYTAQDFVRRGMGARVDAGPTSIRILARMEKIHNLLGLAHGTAQRSRNRPP